MKLKNNECNIGIEDNDIDYSSLTYRCQNCKSLMKRSILVINVSCNVSVKDEYDMITNLVLPMNVIKNIDYNFLKDTEALEEELVLSKSITYSFIEGTKIIESLEIEK